MKPRIDTGGRQGRDPEFIQGNSSASKPGAHMPITFEGDEPDEISLWQWVADMTPTWRDVAGGLAVLALVAAVATYFFNH